MNIFKQIKDVVKDIGPDVVIKVLKNEKAQDLLPQKIKNKTVITNALKKINDTDESAIRAEFDQLTNSAMKKKDAFKDNATTNIPIALQSNKVEDFEPVTHNYDCSKKENSILIKLGASGISGHTDPLAIVKGLIDAIREVSEFTEIQKTERCKIEQEKQMAIKQIEAETERFMLYLNRSFDEREKSFARLFANVDVALKTDNIQALGLCLDSINKLAAASQFKELVNVKEVEQKLTGKTEWNF